MSGKGWRYRIGNQKQSNKRQTKYNDKAKDKQNTMTKQKTNNDPQSPTQKTTDRHEPH